MSSGSSWPRCTSKSSSPAAASSSTAARPMNRVPPRTTTLKGLLSGLALGRAGRRLAVRLAALGVGVALDDEVDQAPVLGLLGSHEVVALHVTLDLLQRALAVLGVNPSQLLALAEDLLSVDLDVRRLALDALGERLVDEDLRVRQRHAHAGVAAGEQPRRTARSEPGAQRGDLRRHVLHRVVDGQGGRQRSAGAFDVDLD